MHGETASFEGLIRKDPINKAQITLAALSCNSNKTEGIETGTSNINTLNPDLIFFAGDQSYDHKEHTAAWLKFGLQFRELFGVVLVLPFLMTTTLDKETSGAKVVKNLCVRMEMMVGIFSILNMSKWWSEHKLLICQILITKKL